MKIGILTQPLNNNYGGLIQAWALQKTLYSMGHSAIIINRDFTKPEDLSLPKRIIDTIERELRIILGREKRQVTLSEYHTNLRRKNLIPFIQNRYRGISPRIFSDKILKKYVESENFEAFVVGSDQVWRPSYSPAIGNFFLDFLSPTSKAKRIAYAASFGVDNWEYNDHQTRTFRNLAIKFNLITVRESSGVKLVNDYLHCKASQVLDPTMLLSSEDYTNLIVNPTVPVEQSDGSLFCYVLDPNPKLNNIIEKAETNTRLKAYYCNARKKVIASDFSNHLDECVFPAVEQWLKSFQDAEMVITDSFHGTIFSILFNKPFWLTLNQSRGATRFTSLLKIFGLEDRIITDLDNANWLKPINWDKVNAIHKAKSLESKKLLLQAL